MPASVPVLSSVTAPLPVSMPVPVPTPTPIPLPCLAPIPTLSPLPILVPRCPPPRRHRAAPGANPGGHGRTAGCPGATRRQNPRPHPPSPARGRARERGAAPLRRPATVHAGSCSPAPRASSRTARRRTTTPVCPAASPSWRRASSGPRSSSPAGGEAAWRLCSEAGGGAGCGRAGPGEPGLQPPFSFAELELRRRRGALGRRPVLVLALEDPWAGVGSGGATLNAVLVAAEHLSARAGCTVRAGGVGSGSSRPPPAPPPGPAELRAPQVVSADALKEARILILHTVRARAAASPAALRPAPLPAPPHPACPCRAASSPSTTAAGPSPACPPSSPAPRPRRWCATWTACWAPSRSGWASGGTPPRSDAPWLTPGPLLTALLSPALRGLPAGRVGVQH